MILSVLTLLAVAGSQTPAPASSASQATIVFQFENPQLQPASYSIEIREDGSGRYKSNPAPPAAASADPAAASDPQDVIAPQSQDREIRIEEPLRAQLFAAARSHQFFAMACEAPKIHVAFTGKKTLSYSGPDGHGSCTYNYSRDAELNRIADELVAVAFTLEEGQRLAVEHGHSRLALDAEMETLEDAARNNRALEIQNIAPELKSIADDESVLLRARKRANALLAAGSPPAR
jgi:hypothetical protein